MCGTVNSRTASSPTAQGDHQEGTHCRCCRPVAVQTAACTCCCQVASLSRARGLPAGADRALPSRLSSRLPCCRHNDGQHIFMLSGDTELQSWSFVAACTPYMLCMAAAAMMVHAAGIDRQLCCIGILLASTSEQRACPDQHKVPHSLSKAGLTGDRLDTRKA